MKSTDAISKNDILRNTILGKTKIKLNMHDGVMRGNIIDTPSEEVSSVCLQNALDFSCEENSQYIPAI